MGSTWTGKQRSAQKGLMFMLRFKFYFAGVRSHLQWGVKPRPILERCCMINGCCGLEAARVASGETGSEENSEEGVPITEA